MFVQLPDLVESLVLEQMNLEVSLVSVDLGDLEEPLGVDLVVSWVGYQLGT